MSDAVYLSESGAGVWALSRPASAPGARRTGRWAAWRPGGLVIASGDVTSDADGRGVQVACAARGRDALIDAGLLDPSVRRRAVATHGLGR